jgi:hypothetical protein
MTKLLPLSNKFPGLFFLAKNLRKIYKIVSPLAYEGSSHAAEPLKKILIRFIFENQKETDSSKNYQRFFSKLCFLHPDHLLPSQSHGTVPLNFLFNCVNAYTYVVCNSSLLFCSCLSVPLTVFFL